MPMAQDPTPPFTPERLQALEAIPTADLPSPCYVIHLGRLEENLQILDTVRQRTGAKILLAQKGYACWSTYPLLARYLDGTTASGLHEALLGQEKFGGEVHVYSPAYKEEEIRALARFAHTLVFNTWDQFARWSPLAREQHPVECGIRVNPEHSTVETDLYNPCSPASRLGTTRALLDAQRSRCPRAPALDGLHFHALCEQDADALDETATAFEQRFGDLIPGLKWLNFGGGHHITRPGYDIDRLCAVIDRFKSRWPLDIYLEPGEAIALHTGLLVVTVLDVMQAGDTTNLILDSSATCHMPDVLEMPYRPRILGAGEPGELAHTCRLGGMSCLAGDVIGDYSFDQIPQPGDRLTFLDMAHYTMVKNTAFNGVPLPAIALYDPTRNNPDIIRRFTYADYRDRLS